MNSFVSLENNSYITNYFFTKNHFVLLLISLVIIIFFSMYISRQNLKHQKDGAFILGFFLLIFECLRIYWRYKYLQFNNQSLDFLNITNLDIFTLSLWISIPLIIISSIVKRKKTKFLFGLDFVFNISLILAIATLIYPLNINQNFDFYHCYNLLYTLIRSFIILLGLMFAFSKWISVENFLDLWKTVISLVCLLVCCSIVYFVLNSNNNLFYIEYFPVFEMLGIYIEAPYHLIVLGIFIFALQVFLYLPFIAHKYKKLKN